VVIKDNNSLDKMNDALTDSLLVVACCFITAARSVSKTLRFQTKDLFLCLKKVFK